MWLSTCHMCFIKAILEHFRARRRLRFGSPDIVWPVQSRTMVSVDQHGVVNFCESYVSWSWRRGQIDNFHNSALPLKGYQRTKKHYTDEGVGWFLQSPNWKFLAKLF